MKEYIAATTFSFLIAVRGPSLDPLLMHMYFILNFTSHYFPDRPKFFCIISSFLNVLMKSIILFILQGLVQIFLPLGSLP